MLLHLLVAAVVLMTHLGDLASAVDVRHLVLLMVQTHGMHPEGTLGVPSFPLTVKRLASAILVCQQQVHRIHGKVMHHRPLRRTHHHYFDGKTAQYGDKSRGLAMTGLIHGIISTAWQVAGRLSAVGLSSCPCVQQMHLKDNRS